MSGASGCTLAPRAPEASGIYLVLGLVAAALAVRRRRWLAAALALFGGCADPPARVAATLAARAPELAARLGAAPGTWQREGVRLTSPGWRSAQSGPFLDVGARLPDAADGSVEVGIGQSPDLTLTLRAEACRPVRVDEDAGRAVYADAYPSTDLIFVATRARLEWFLLLREARAPSVFSYRVSLPAGLTVLAATGSGGLRILDRSGRARLAMPRPFAVDARGVQRPASVEVTDGRLVVRLDPRGLTFPLLLDPAIETGVWTEAAHDSFRRTEHALAYDSARGRTVLFGGSGPDGLLGDTWEWDGSAWTQKFPALSPAPRRRHTLAFDALRGRTILFGGASDSTSFGDTWQWDGSAWTQLAPAASPPARDGHALVFDSTRGRGVLFGGVGANGRLGDTWEWDGVTWLERVTASSPTARERPSMSFDAARGRTVLFGGLTNIDLNDTWEWDGTTWTQRAPTMIPPVSTTAGPMVFDSLRARSVLCAPTTWEWDGTDWSSVGATPIFSGAAAFDSGRARTVLFAGIDSQSIAAGTQPTQVGDTWEWDGTTWAQRALPPVPPVRSWPAMAFDAARSRVLLFGGQEPSTGFSLGDTWEWDGTAWAARAPTTLPPGRQEHALAFEPARGRTLLYGGFQSRGIHRGGTYLDDTWEWDGTDWTAQAPTMIPQARADHALATDTVRGRVVLFGGIGPAGRSTIILGDTWEWDGTDWIPVAPPQSPSARLGHALAFDPGRARAVLFGGTDNLATFGDTWEWDGTNWTDRAPALAPPARTAHALAFDIARGRAVLFGGTAASSGLLADTWEWNGATWVERTPALGPPARAGHALAFDAARGQVVLFGGGLGETWVYGSRGGACTTGAQCDSGFCVDGVCCQRASCGTCESCNGSTPGLCTPVTNGLDPDSCPAPSVCGPLGACGAASGQACTFGASCATGFCVDRLCCDRACNGPCDVCAASRGATSDGVCFTPATCVPGKNLGDTCATDAECVTSHCADGVCCDSACDGLCVTCTGHGPGVCGPAPSQTDPRGSCAGEPGCGGSCDGAGQCQFPPAGTRCDTCKACNGGGKCNQLPADSDDLQCGAIACGGLSTECVRYPDLTSHRCVAPGLCAGPNDPATCTSTFAADGTPCAAGACLAGQCQPRTQTTAPGAGGCSAIPAPGAQPPIWAVPWVLALSWRRRARFRRSSGKVRPPGS
jgi:hypothetical protein